MQLAAEYPRYGYRRITAMLHRQGQVVNNKRVLRLMRELQLVGKSPKRRCRTTNSNHTFKRHPNRVIGLNIERPDQVWVGDITDIRLGSEFVYLAVLMYSPVVFAVGNLGAGWKPTSHGSPSNAR